MDLITPDELKKKLDEQDNFKLVFVLGDWHYHAKHIPGSISVPDQKSALKELNTDDDIVVYCSNVYCSASTYAHDMLIEPGYENVKKLDGGLYAWEESGYPLTGNMVD